ncbi:MAG: glycerophosphodiester phosphodiesterase family protein [Desulfococcaceae bacterium]|jgi:glycerophosphoryl diester phosphodiesterase|nr:glycerophosphodiester phosphodiesterase family protein [Desulfococcaceae bacterium]
MQNASVSIASAKYPMLIAHRGYRAAYPENTLSAFRAAVNGGVQMIELDVSLSKDRKLVVMHDETLDRTTDGRGRVCDSTLAEIRKLDAGSRFSPDFAGEAVPTLAEVLELAAGRVRVNIEIKAEAFEADVSPEVPDTAERQVAELIGYYHLRDSVLVSSFEPGILQRFSDFPDHPALGVLTEKVKADEILSFCRNINAFSWNPDYPVLDRRQVQLMQKEGFRVFPYTVNEKDEIRRLLEMGVDGFFTDEIRFSQYLNPV